MKQSSDDVAVTLMPVVEHWWTRAKRLAWRIIKVTPLIAAFAFLVWRGHFWPLMGMFGILVLALVGADVAKVSKAIDAHRRTMERLYCPDCGADLVVRPKAHKKATDDE